MQILFGSNNQHKLDELKELAGNRLQIISPAEKGLTEEPEEPYDSFRENAQAKSLFYYEKTGLDCFSEDAGLVVEALNGAPGVYSARYAGPQKNTRDNIQKLLHEMQGLENRKAHFIAVICLVYKGKTYYFEGVCNGSIAREASGTGGFGYDPVFIPEGFGETFAVLDKSVKNNLSHRKNAFDKLFLFLNGLKVPA
jgi:XTP/dITP diphosphohydrolase